jgi:nitroreductase
MSQPTRIADHPIDPIFLERWSSRALTGEAIPDEILFTCFEAARWAPSGSNRQPWRFVYTKHGSERWPVFLSLLAPLNQAWAEKASALVFVLSNTLAERDGKLVPSRTHSFDAGAAWFSFALQASIAGWTARAMAGIDRDAARVALHVPDRYAVEAGIAIGRRVAAADVPEDLRAREVQTTRLPLQAIVSEGIFAET